MKRIFAIIAAIFLTNCAFADLKYIEIESKQNLPMIRIKTIEDFEAIINAYDISLVFLQYDSDLRPSFNSVSKNSEAFIIAGNTYFVFFMEGYKTLADYKSGKTANFKTSSDYEQAKSLGIGNAEFFYYYDRNSFQNINDANNAYKNGFVFYTAFRTQSASEQVFSSSNKLVFNENNPCNKESDAYYEAKKLGYVNYTDYKEYKDYTAKGFITKEEYLSAKSKGFYNADEVKTAEEAGFINKEEFTNAQKLGLKTKSDFTDYNEITVSIDKISNDAKIEKKNAIVVYFMNKLPKGEMSLSVLSNTLKDDFSKNSMELRKALNFYANDVKNQGEYDKKQRDRYSRNQTIDIANLFYAENLKKFFKEVNISQIGSYNENAEIFKRR